VAAHLNIEQGHLQDTIKDISDVRTGNFATSEEAALAFDETSTADGEGGAELNFSGNSQSVGLHVLDSWMSLCGDDGSSVIGVQAGVMTTLRVSLRIIDPRLNYLEILLDEALKLPKMDSGLGTCDAYCRILLVSGQTQVYAFRSRVVRNSLDPAFAQMFRMSIPPHLFRHKAALTCKIEIWDWDRFDEDDHIGTAEVPLFPFISAAHRDLHQGVTAPQPMGVAEGGGEGEGGGGDGGLPAGPSSIQTQVETTESAQDTHHVYQGVVNVVKHKKSQVSVKSRYFTLDRKCLKYYAHPQHTFHGSHVLGVCLCVCV
jgi:hypothetical protein